MTKLEQAARQALHALNIQTPLEQREFELRNLAISALREALEQPKQEPVLWGCKFNKGNRLDTFYTKGAAERFVEGSLRNGADVSLVGLYTEPPKRDWSNLSDGVMCDIAIDHGLMSIDWIKFARAIEAKLKEKNA